MQKIFMSSFYNFQGQAFVPQLMHITRYIHLNNSSYKTWPWSSYHDYAREHPRNWINSAPILELFTGKEAYLEFVDDYAELQRERDSIKKELAAG